MGAASAQFSLPLPDDPNKWDGWTKYKSSNFYERLCLDPKQNPTAEHIEEHCRELMRWWQKKLPLKNQPSNPLTQILRPGLDESSRYLAEARVQLLDPQRRRAMDDELVLQARESAIAEFHKFLTFAIADGTLTPDGEKNLFRFGHEHGLTDEMMNGYIEEELKQSGARRGAAVTPAVPAPAVEQPRAPRRRLPPKEEFKRMLRLTALDSDGMSDDTRDAFVNMAENLGIEPSDAEDIIDDYLDEADGVNGAAVAELPPTVARVRVEQPSPAAAPKPSASKEEHNHAEETPKVDPAEERRLHPPFTNSFGGQMIFVPSGEFMMGSEAPDAGPNEKPLTKVTLSRFYLSKFPVTNAEYEEFDVSHKRKRAPGAGDKHPVIYVSSLEAIKFCQWLSTRERKKYRLPTEAEWEYAARGTDGRKYPWGNHGGRGDLGNFADKNTVFAWSDHSIDDGFAETSPVGSYPAGASPFGIQDMGGNVWEWCHDYYEAYRGTHKVNPRGAPAGQKRIYRGGSWKSRFNSMRATTRSSNAPNFSCNDLGFRVVCECE